MAQGAQAAVLAAVEEKPTIFEKLFGKFEVGRTVAGLCLRGCQRDRQPWIGKPRSEPEQRAGRIGTV